MAPQPLQGSSRTTGGILRGKALGNVFNYGDTDDITLPTISGKGMVKVHDTLVEDHGESPKMVLKIAVCPTLGPVMRMLGKHVPYIQGN